MVRSPSVLLVAAVVAPLLVRAIAGPVYSTAGGGGATGDLFDVSRGTQVIASTPQHNSCCGNSDPRMALGFGALPPWVEPGTAIFADGPGPGHIDTLEWETPGAVDLTRLEIRLAQDGATNPYRGTSAYRLLASQDGIVFSQVSGGNIPLRNGVMANAPLLVTDVSLTGTTTNLRAFRLELTRLSDGGPRLIEIDGFGTPAISSGEFLDRLAFNGADNALTGRAAALRDDEGPGLVIGFSASSRQNGVDSLEDAFGRSTGALEPDAFSFADGGVPDNGNTVWGDGGETVDFVAWQTGAPLSVSGYRLDQGGADGAARRDLELVRFLVDGTPQDLFDNDGNAGETLRRFPGGPIEGTQFRLELTRRTSAGPRLIEIDALLTPSPPSPPLTNGIVLNEIVSWNDESAVDEDGDSPPWLELFNASELPASLAGWGLSDDPGQPRRWTFPPTTLAARAYLRVFASGKDRHTELTWLHTNFRIDPDGETLSLTRPDGTLADRAVVPRLRRDVSYGRLPNGLGSWKYLATPTPHRSNSPQKSYDSLLFDVPVFSQPGGFHPDALALRLESFETNTVVRFTLDGSDPTEDSPLFTTPLAITSRAGDANSLSMISGTATANQHTDGWKPPLGEVRKATVVRARAFRPGALPGPIGTQTYFIGAGARRTDGLPTLSIVSAPQGLFDYFRGIYMLGAVFDQYVAAHAGEGLTGHTPANYTQRGPAWERPAHLEYYGPDGALDWTEPVVLDIQGQSSRSFRQKSFGLKARGEAGTPNTIEYPLFPGLTRLGDGRPLFEFRHLRLRNAGNDWDHAMMRDDWCHRLVNHLDLDLMSSRPVSTYLDGEYWGVLTVREQEDPQYLREHYGVDPTEAVILYGDGSLEEGRVGDDQPFRQLRDYVSRHDLSTPAYYDYVGARMDVDNFLRYQLCEIYFANADWPQNNMRVWRRRLATPDPTQPRGRDGRWRWFLFDVDLGTGHPWSAGYTEDTLAVALSPTGRPGSDAPWATAFLRALIRNPEFKRAFLNTAADLLNSSFLASHAVALVDAMEAELLPAMDEHIRRWRSCGNSVAAWRQQVQVVRTFARNRPNQMRQHFVNALARTGTVSVTLDVADPPTGRVRINSLLVDTNLPGVAATPYPWRGTYFRDAPVTLEAIAAPGHRFAGWTGLASTNRVATIALTNALTVTATFVPAPQDLSALIINEVHYHPPTRDGVTDDPVEFIELKNTGTAALDLSGLAFTQGIAFTFTNATTLAPGRFLVLAGSLADFAARFPAAPAHGAFSGHLDNAGETLELGYPGGPAVLALAYDDAPPWPTRPDGLGFSLQRANGLPGPADPANWCAAPPSPGGDTPAEYLDRDGDGLPDVWESAHRLDPDLAADAHQDPDGDQLTNRQEFLVRTDPHDPLSVLRFEGVERQAESDSVVLSFIVRANTVCRVQGRPSLGPSAWLDLATFTAAPADRLVQFTNRVDMPGGFYRLVVPLDE